MKTTHLFQKVVGPTRISFVALVCLIGLVETGETFQREGLETVQVVKGPRGVLRFEIRGVDPNRVTLSSVPMPPSVTVHVPGRSQGDFTRPLTVNVLPVLEVVPMEFDQEVQLVFRLTHLVEPRVLPGDNTLVLDFPKTQEASPATVQPTVQTVSTKGKTLWSRNVHASGTQAETKQSPAKFLEKIEVQRKGTSAMVKLFGDGVLSHKAVVVDPGRLVIDLPEVASALHRQMLPVDHLVLKRIRIGHYTDKVRLVFDLSKPVTYSIQPRGDYLAVQLNLGAPIHNKKKSHGRKFSPRVSVSPRSPDLDPSHNNVVGTSRKGLPNSGKADTVTLHRSKPRFGQMEPGSGSSSISRDIGRAFKGRRISLDFQGADISNVLRLIAEVSGLNIVVGEGVKAKVTMKLVNIPWDQALDMLLKMNNLGMVQEGNIAWIDSLANIAKQQEAEARAQESKIKAEKLVTRVVYIKNVSARGIEASLKRYVSPRGKMKVNKVSNAIIIEDTESKIRDFVRLVRQLDLVVPQVQIEARIVQADTSFSRSLGVQWGLESVNTSTDGSFEIVGNLTGPFSEVNVAGSDGTFERNFLVNLPAAVTGLSSVPAIGYNVGNLGGSFDLDLRLSAGELLGLTKVIAAPRITTLDNQEAKIEQGESIPFQTTSLQGTQTTFVDANLTLQVTPQITSRDPNEKAKLILMKVKATRNAVGARSNPAGPSIDKREATTQVLVRDGETMVIGGIFVDNQINNVGGVPYLSRIPVLGWLFKNKTESVSKQELLIFLTPTIVS